MPRISLSGFKDPARRPRYLLWTGAAVLVLAAVMIVALGVTSTKWFCSEGCHKVQDDTILAYEASTHSEVSCMACHMPVQANPVVFILHKAEALGELYLTVTNNYELPLNGESHLALTMPTTQCTQCHSLDTREPTPARGIIIDHDVHEEQGVECAVCHNRVAHKENFELTLTDPATGKPNTKHADFMLMTSCFRCHSQGETAEGGLKAPGDCEACHTENFDLKPESHDAPDFYPAGHATLATAEYDRVEKLEAEESSGTAEEGGPGESGEDELGPSLPKVESINECSTCHAEKFCSDCHGLPMPHPTEFAKDHGKAGTENPKVCATCHGNVDQFCDDCHHGTALGYEDRAAGAWLPQHPQAVVQTGANACFECHDPTYCASCHVSGGTQ